MEVQQHNLFLMLMLDFFAMKKQAKQAKRVKKTSIFSVPERALQNFSRLSILPRNPAYLMQSVPI